MLQVTISNHILIILSIRVTVVILLLLSSLHSLNSSRPADRTYELRMAEVVTDEHLRLSLRYLFAGTLQRFEDDEVDFLENM